MARGDRICFVDKTNYHYCPSCGGNPDETWRFLFCSHNCWDIEKVWEDYCRDELISREEAVERLRKLDTSKIADYRDQIRQDLIELLKDDKLAQNKGKKIMPKSKAISERKKNK